MSAREIHSGYVELPEGRRRYYYTDDVDALPPDIREYRRASVARLSWSALYDVTKVQEGKGHEVCIQIGELFYETLEGT